MVLNLTLGKTIPFKVSLQNCVVLLGLAKNLGIPKVL